MSAHLSISKKSSEKTTLLVGNPNVGKSVIFGYLTGRYATVSNYPGTTVEVAKGPNKSTGSEVIDLPGTNSLIPTSEDETVTRDALLHYIDKKGVDIVQVCDAKNLRRGLVITLQLAELEAPQILVTNMLDEARSRGVKLDPEKLGEILGIEVIGAVATRRQGLRSLANGTNEYRPSKYSVRYDQAVEEAILKITRLLPENIPGKRGIALMFLAGDHSLEAWGQKVMGENYLAVLEIQVDLARRYAEGLRFEIARTRLAAADKLVPQVMETAKKSDTGFSRRFGDWAMHPIWGLPISMLVLYITYLFVGVLGAGYSVDFLQGIFDGHITPFFDSSLRAILPDGGVENFLVGPKGIPMGTGMGLLVGDYGLLSMAVSYSVAIVLPIVGFFFIAFSIMEDSGYLPRLSVVLNRLFKLIGLNGKAILPMVLGLGCGTMATMTTRILGTRKERMLVTLLLALGVPCSAQLGVVLGMLSGLSVWGSLIWLSTIAGVMLLVGYLGNKVLPGNSGAFLMELPPMRRPVLSNILIKTVSRIEWYLLEAVPLFLLGTFMLWTLSMLNVLGAIRTFTAPIVQGFLNLPEEATDAFLVGFLRRDYGAAGLYNIYNEQLSAGALSTEIEIQIIVAMTTITLFIPCIAAVFMIVKELGGKAAIGMVAFIFPFAFLVGGFLNFVLRALWL
ncbi:ferrous iron transport protein B [Myxococcota bacterium]|nr:ferrous iron transport protein B [Myxococcota bacterium]